MMSDDDDDDDDVGAGADDAAADGGVPVRTNWLDGSKSVDANDLRKSAIFRDAVSYASRIQTK